MDTFILKLFLICELVVSMSSTPVSTSALNDVLKTQKLSTPDGHFLDRLLSMTSIPKESFMTTPQMIAKEGYTPEIHHVVTGDGYVLELHRISPKRHVRTGNTGTPILLLHGVSLSSAIWVFNGNQSMAFALADAEFDVWLINYRGNVYSRRHMSLSPEEKEFWQYSVDEIVKYDLPATIEYIQDQTGHERMYLHGYSMGGTIALGYLSTFPENNFIKHTVLFAPTFSLEHMKTNLNYLANPVVKAIVKRISAEISSGSKNGEIWDNSPFSRLVGRSTKIPIIGEAVHRMMESLFVGRHAELIPKEKLPVFMAHIPAGFTATLIDHYTQIMQTGKLQHMDWGSPSENMRHYGKAAPAEYPLHNITSSVTVYYGNNDQMVPESDVRYLERTIPKCRVVLVNNEQWGHLEFMWSLEAKKLVYDDMISKLLHIEEYGTV